MGRVKYGVVLVIPSYLLFYALSSGS